MNDVQQRHMSEVSDAPPGDSRDVTQFSHNLHQYSSDQQKMSEICSGKMKRAKMFITVRGLEPCCSCYLFPLSGREGE